MIHRIVFPFVITLFSLVFIFSCKPSQVAKEEGIQTGTWRAVLDLEGDELPFNLEITREGETFSAFLINGEERLSTEYVLVEPDSIFIRMQIFDTEVQARIVNPTLIEGTWRNYSRPGDYQIPFQATHGIDTRFLSHEAQNVLEVSGKWEVLFFPEDGGSSPAVGVFEQDGKKLSGTFLTETGDYRYLEGIAEGESMKLSVFDGEHAFLFQAQVQSDGKLIGWFKSGTHWREDWTAKRNDRASLSDPNTLTYLKPGYDNISFSFPNLENKNISLNDPKFQDKVVIVQLMGSWCPNCMDETKLFNELYGRYNGQGLEIIGLAYERKKDFPSAVKAVKRLQEHFDIPYELLIAGSSNKDEAAKTLPMLNKILAFPTAIYLDRQGRIRKIHTGFSGPGTGDEYVRLVEETTGFIEKLLAETQGS